MGVAQQQFKTMLKEHLAPALRERGFAGSGQKYTLDDADYYVSLAIQRSRRESDSQHVCFRLNVSVTSKKAWHAARTERPGLDERPSAESHPPARRLHGLGPVERERPWWVLATEEYEPRPATKVYRIDGLHRLRGAIAVVPEEAVETDISAMAATVVDTVERVTVPAIQAEKARQSRPDAAS